MYLRWSNRLRPAAPALLVLVLAWASEAYAIVLPTGPQADEVVDYVYSDASRPVLMDFGLCRGIHRNGERKYGCKDPLAESEIKAGMKVYAWMKFLVPRNAQPRIQLRIDHDGIRRDTFTRVLEPAVRYRTWHEVQVGKNGHWRFEVFHVEGARPERLYSRSITVR